MEFEFHSKLIAALVKAGAKSKVFRGEEHYGRSRDIDSRYIDPRDFPLIRETIKRHEFYEFVENRRILPKIEALEALQEKSATHEVKKLELLAEAIRLAVLGAPNKWVFMESEGILLPYFVDRVTFHAHSFSHGHYTPAHVQVDLEAIVRGKKKEEHATFHKEDLPGTAAKVLSGEGLLLATTKLVDNYMEELQTYEKEAPRTGEQFLARGEGSTEDEHAWQREEVFFEKAGEPSKVIMDDEEDRGEDSDVADMTFWLKEDPEERGIKKKQKTKEASLDEVTVLLPIHPIVRVFSLSTHSFALVHVNYLERYVYDTKVGEKLVLPTSVRKLIDALTSPMISRFSDIIRGKAQGVMILCSGRPGTGKTLTGEVYSEVVQRPLYNVQCSQLGTDEVQLEKKLGEVLERATRWRAILLIDEADVYIHERGTDIVQNAIVGVFLRLLEYYNGILFLTTNRATIIDDAIISRMTAHVRFELPEPAAREKLWSVLLEQYQAHAGPVFLRQVVHAFPNVSGRTIRQLIRLGLFIAKAEDPNAKLKVSHLLKASRFHDLETEEENGTA